MHARQTLFMITLAAAVALPVLVYLALGADNRNRALEFRLANLNRQQAELVAYTKHLARFRDHVALVQRFTKAAKRFGVGPENWDTHQVDIKDMFVSYADLPGFIADMGPSHDSYFVPKLLDIQVKPTVTYQDVATTGGQSKVFAGGVTLNLTGAFLVEH